MAVKIMIPTPLRQYVGKQDQVEVEAKTVAEALSKLASEYSELRFTFTTRRASCAASSTSTWETKISASCKKSRRL